MFLYGPHTINGQYVACQFPRYNIYREIFCGVIIWYADGDQDEWYLPWRHCGLVYCMALCAMLLRTVMHNGYLSGTTISPSINKGDGMNMALITGCHLRGKHVYYPFISWVDIYIYIDKKYLRWCNEWLSYPYTMRKMNCEYENMTCSYYNFIAEYGLPCSDWWI